MPAAAILLGDSAGGTVNITGAAAEIRGNITGSGAGQHTVNFALGAGNFHAYTGMLNAIANTNRAVRMRFIGARLFVKII